MKAFRLELYKGTEENLWKGSLEIKETDSDLRITLTKSFPAPKDLFEDEIPSIFDVERIHVCYLDVFKKLVTCSIILNDVRLLKRTFACSVHEDGTDVCFLGKQSYKYHRSEAIWTYTFSASKDIVKTFLSEKVSTAQTIRAVCDFWSVPDSWGI